MLNAEEVPCIATPPLSLSISHSLTHTHTHTYTHTQTRARRCTQIYTCTRTQAHAHTHKHATKEEESDVMSLSNSFGIRQTRVQCKFILQIGQRKLHLFESGERGETTRRRRQVWLTNIDHRHQTQLRGCLVRRPSAVGRHLAALNQFRDVTGHFGNKDVERSSSLCLLVNRHYRQGSGPREGFVLWYRQPDGFRTVSCFQGGNTHL